MFEQFPSTSTYEVVYNSTAASRTLPCWALLRTVEYLNHRIQLREYFTNDYHQSFCIKGKKYRSLFYVSFVKVVNLVLLLKRYALKAHLLLIPAHFALLNTFSYYIRNSH